MTISVIIPMYNEKRNAENTAIALEKTLSEAFGEDYEVIFSNDGSADGCDQIIAEYAKSHPRVKLVGDTVNHGKGYAVRRGMLASSGDFVLFTDCDLAYGTDVIVDFYKKFAGSRPDLLVGSRRLDKSGYEGYTLKRKLMSEIYIKTINLFSGYRGTDSQCGIKGFSGEAAKKIFSFCETDRFAFDLEALLIAKKFGYKVTEHPVKILVHGESSVRPVHDALEMLSQIRKIKKRIRKIPNE